MQKNIDLLAEWRAQPLPGGVRLAFPAPPNARGFYDAGFVRRSDVAFDGMGCWGLALTVSLAAPGAVTVAVETADREPLTLTAAVPAAGRRTLRLPWRDFPVETADEAAWQFITAVAVTGCTLESARLLRTPGLAAECPVRGRHAPAGGTVVYRVTLYNPGLDPAAVQPRQVFAGWEGMAAAFDPPALTLPPDGEGTVAVRLTLPAGMAPGGHEDTVLRFVPNGDGAAAAELRLSTLCELPHPYIYHDADGWAAVAARLRDPVKGARYRPQFERWRADADAWTPTPPAPGQPYCYYTDIENCTMACGYLYAITGERRYAEKLAAFFRFFTDEQTGYPARLRGCHQSYVQEGHFFQHLAIPYDLIWDSGVLTPADHAAIEGCFRLYMAMLDKDIRRGHISNWVLSEVTGALYCALAIQDWELAERFAFGPCGVVQQFRCGTFGDGWWHEGSIGYNTWVSSMVLHCARALRPFGIDLTHASFPVNYSRSVSSCYGGAAGAHRQGGAAGAGPAALGPGAPADLPPFGMVNEKWGGWRRNALRIRDLFDAPLPFLDWRGVMFGVNDSDEKTIDGVHFGSTYDLAYTCYGEDAYRRVIRSFAAPDPVFGVDLAEDKPDPPLPAAACSDNMGLILLRSRTPGRPAADQLQAALHYGSHGGAHGHFDIGNLLSVMRCGRSLYNPECNWWGYRHFLYKWHVQNSLTKNLVNVDDKMQLPAPSRRLLLYSGEALQAAALEWRCQWAWPPYGGMDYDDSPGDFAKRLRMNVAWFPVDRSLPYARLTGFTEPVLQRRVLAVTDDYLVLFDYAAGETDHQYETTFQLKGLRSLDAPRLTDLGHTDQYSTEPACDGQMITDCRWYAAEGGSVARFCQHFAGDDGVQRGERSGHNIPGVLHTDIYTAWPPATTQVTGQTATYFGWPADRDGYNLPLRWRAEADGETLAEGSLDAWVLGRQELAVDLAGRRTLALCISQGDVQDEKGRPVRTPAAAFWAGAVLTMADGTARRLADLPYESDNTDPGRGIGRDYAGGRVTIMGREYPDAIPASPRSHNREGRLTWQLPAGAVRLQAAVGADAFPGDEGENRRFYAVRASRGRTARFVTVIEPYESRRMVRTVRAESADVLTVALADGRVQRLTLTGLEAGAPALTLAETGGPAPRRETASPDCGPTAESEV